MHSKPELREILYIFSPLLIYFLIYFAVSSLTEAVLWGIEEHSAAVTPGTGDPALYYAAGIFRKYICQILPTAAGCLGVRRTAIAEISAFPRKYPLVLRDSGWKTPVPENIYPVLLTSTAALAAALNVLFSILLPVPEMSAMESTFVPGLTGLILQAAFYGFFMPFSEELLFRGILFARLERPVFCSCCLIGSLWRLARLFGPGILCFFHGSGICLILCPDRQDHNSIRAAQCL